MTDAKYIFTTLIIAILAPFASDSFLPSLPQMTEYFGTSEMAMQFTITIYFFGLACFQLLWGPFSDKLGRKKALQYGGVIALIGCGIAGAAVNPFMLYIGRFIQGAGGAANASLCRTVLRDRFTGTRLSQAAGIIGIFFALIPSIAPLIGGLIQEVFFWRANFIFLFFLTLVILIYITKAFPETNKNLNHRAMHWDQFKDNYKTILQDKPFWGYTIAASCGFSGLIAYYTISPFLMQNVLGLSPLQYGLTALTVTLGLMGGHVINTFSVKKIGIERMLEFGFLLMFLSGLLLLGLEFSGFFSIATILVPTLIFIFGAAFTFANGSAGAIQHFGHIAGSAAAMYGFLQILGTTIVAMTISLFPSQNGFSLGVTYLTLALLASAGYLTLVPKDKHS